MKKKVVLTVFTFCCVMFSVAGFASEEGTRHITGDGVDLYFMNDKLFGHVDRHPLWAIYNCGVDIKGEIDINGTYHPFQMVYQRGGNRILTGTVGQYYVALGDIKRTKEGFVYQVFIKEKEYAFSIKYERIEDEHLVNSVIEGDVGKKKKIKMVVDGHLCPFATTGIICIAAGSAMLL
jgi:hypothetical protein